MRVFWFAVLGLLVAPLWSSEVYRSVDADGNVRYSDRPEGNNVEKVLIAVPRSTPAARPARSAGGTDPAANPATAVAGPAPTPAEPSAEERERNCATARERVERYQVSHRL